MNLPIIGGGINSRRALVTHSEYTMNFYAEVNEPTDKTPSSLIGTPGLVLFTSVTSNNGACRGFYTTGGNLFFVVVGDQFIEIDADGNQTVRGTLLTFAGHITLVENVNLTTNTTQIMIVDGSYGYIYKLSDNSFTRITSEGYTAGTHVIYKDGFFIQNKAGTNQFVYSALYDGLSWSALDYYAAEGNADDVLAIEKLNNDIWIFGQRSIEVYYSTGNSASPFARVSGAYTDIGIGAIYSIAKINNTLFWLGGNLEGDRIVYMANSYSPQRISNHAIEYFLGQIEDVTDAVSFCYQQEGHFFYVLSFANGEKTLCYDLNTGLWHERGYYNSNTGLNERHRAICSGFYNSKVMIGDYANGNIYYFDLNTYTDNGNTIKRIRQSGHVHQDRKRIFFHNFELDMQRGIGLETGQGSDPQVMLQWSNDGGHTWSNEDWTTAGQAGAVGEYYSRIKWNRLGCSRDRVFKITVTDPVKWIIASASSDISIES